MKLFSEELDVRIRHGRLYRDGPWIRVGYKGVMSSGQVLLELLLMAAKWT